MKNTPSKYVDENLSDDEQRQAYYRACIAEFQQLGYQDQYLAQCDDNLVPVLGVEQPVKKP